MTKRMNIYRAEKKGGFTIIEMMVVIGLFGILTTLIVVNASEYRAKARDRVRIADIQRLRLALEKYKAMCGEYPELLDPDTNNGCSGDLKLSSFIKEIPIAPSYPDNSDALHFIGSSGIFADSQVSPENAYLYAGLSSSLKGKCYDYHIGAFLEKDSGALSEDHDIPINSGSYKYSCRNSRNDFGFSSEKDYNANHLYNFRSRKSS